jgi:uncharacterized membrane protein YozB (DUF420 family)
MNGVPLFSIGSALSEIFVTCGVLYSIITNLRGKPLPWKLLGGVLTFEVVVNVIYMAKMAARADKSSEISTGMKIFFAAHGMLSLIMILLLVVLFILSFIDIKNGREAWFARHKGFSWAMIVVWFLSVGSGEVIFLMRYGGQLFGGEQAAAVEAPAAETPQQAPTSPPGEPSEEPAAEAEKPG